MKRRIGFSAWAAALVLLAAVLIHANRPDAAPPAAGGQPGDRLPEAAVACLDGSTFDLAAQRGKVVVINLWATWCAPCVKELPSFSALQRQFPDDVAVLALHAPPVTADVAKWLSLSPSAGDIPFAVDEDGALSALLGASSVLPQTVIAGPDGVVTCHHTGALTMGELLELVDAAR